MKVLELMKSHRSVRQYKSDKIDRKLLNTILEAGCRASTTGNMQLYSIVITEKEDMKATLAPLHFNQKAVFEAPTLLTICADFNRFKKWCQFRDAKPGFDNFLSFMNAAVDAILVSQNIALAAESEGLGICYFGTVLYNAESIIEVLNLPKGVVPVAALTIGYPVSTPSQTDRLPLEAIVHEEEYKDYNLERINKFYSTKEAHSESVRFVIDNNKTTLAQVFTDVRYKQLDNELFSRRFFEVLKNQGFLEESLAEVMMQDPFVTVER